MTIKISNIILDIEDDKSVLLKKAAKKLGVSPGSLPEVRIIRESIDARKKDTVKFNYCIEMDLDNEKMLISRISDKDVKVENDTYKEEFQTGTKKISTRPVVVGMGPAGLFAALLLARKGYNPIVFERGEDIENRSKTVDLFWQTGILKENSNVQFGEGGAGTFSDGKLTTRIKDNRCSYVLKALVSGGAPEEILYKAKPHVGTDVLKEVVKNIREEIKSLGGEIHFNSFMNNIITHEGKLKGIEVNNNFISCERVILAIGHSARDTYEMLNENGMQIEQKPFAIGVRVEHPQNLIDRNQYGKFAGHPKLNAAEYRLTHTCRETGRGVYSFCMCPGGLVVATASEQGRLVTNGMSYHARDKKNANSAIVVTVNPEDFISKSPLAGIEFQRKYEELAYKTGGGNFVAPVQLIGDFLKDIKSSKLGSIEPSYRPGYELSDMRECLPDFVVNSLKEGLMAFDRKINGFADNNAIMTGIETRTSAPVRIPRKDDLQSVSFEGVYPAGEGAGFAGGIISAAVDGLKTAENIIKEFAPF